MKPNSTKYAAVCGLLATVAFDGFLQAAVLFQFSTTDAVITPTDDGYDPAVVTVFVAPDVTAPADGDALAAGNEGLNRFWNSEWAGFTLSAANGTTMDDATEFATGYFTFTVAATAGNVLNLTSLDFNSARGGGDPLTQTRGFELYAAADGGAFSFGMTSVLSVANETGTRTDPVPRSADLSGAEFQGIESVTFRYYPLSPATGNSMDFAGMTLNGDVIPEPATAGLLSLALLGALRRRRS